MAALVPVLSKLAQESKVIFRVKQKEGTESLALFDPASIKSGETHHAQPDDESGDHIVVTVEAFGERHPKGELLGEEMHGKNILNFPKKED